jgi:hypothetical protein
MGGGLRPSSVEQEIPDDVRSEEGGGDGVRSSEGGTTTLDAGRCYAGSCDLSGCLGTRPLARPRPGEADEAQPSHHGESFDQGCGQHDRLSDRTELL